MKARALLVARTILLVALLPLFAGCATTDEPLQRGDAGALSSEDGGVAWASPEDAVLRPGHVLRNEMRECPTSFFFESGSNGVMFATTTAYCVRDLVVGSVASYGDHNDFAVLIYSSFITMDEIGETDPNALQYNDLAIYYIDATAKAIANPALPGGGPTALADGREYDVGDRLRSLARGGPAQDDWRESIVAARSGEWALQTYTLLPAAPGTLGGPVVDPEGRAVGIVASLGVFPNPGMNTVARLDTMVAYAEEHAEVKMDLGTWKLSDQIPSREN